MKPERLRSIPSIHRQRGIGVLLVAIVLLGILTVMTLFSLAAGMYETRTASNEARYKMAYQTAQAGLDHGMEFMKANTSNAVGCWLWPGMSRCTAGETARWTRCVSTDRTSPCGSIEPTVADSSIRANYLYYNDANSRAGGADNKTLNLALTPVVVGGSNVGQLVTQIGDFPVDYEVNALLCLYDTVTPSNQCLTASEFTSAYGSGTVPSTTGSTSSSGYGPNNFSSNGLFAMTLVARSRLVAAATATNADTENAQVVLKASTSAYRIIAGAPDVPLIASGAVTGLGNAEIVTNPNAGGTGIPLSIWTPNCIHVTKADACGGSSDASFATCYSDEFFKTGGTYTGAECSPDAPSTGGPCKYQGTITCNGTGSGCSCSAIASMVGNSKTPYGLGALSGHYGGNTVAGPDLLGKNVGGILPDVQYFPLYPLNNPPGNYNNSLFEYVFGTKVASNTSILLDADGNGIDDATDYEQQNFPNHPASCSGLNASSHGFYYLDKGVSCSLPNAQIGSPEAPIVLVTQGDTTFNANTIFFGILFVRSDAGIGGDLTATGAYKIKAAGSGQLYGSAIIEGAPDIAGSPQIIYDSNVLLNVINGPDNTRMGVLPGSWSDAGHIDVTTGTYSER